MIKNCRHLFLGFLLTVWMVAVPRCGTEIGNPEDITVSIVGIDSSVAARLVVRALAGGITLTEARIVLDRIRFRPLSACSGEIEGETAEDFQFDGPFIVDLLANETVPPLGEKTVSAGTYCRVELRLEHLEADEAPGGVNAFDPIVDRSVVIAGTRGDGTPFTAYLDVDVDFDIRNETTGFEVGGTSDVFFIAFDLAEWFASIDLDEAEVKDGVIAIDGASNEEIQEALEAAITGSAKLFEDDDDDGDFDEEDPLTESDD